MDPHGPCYTETWTYAEDPRARRQAFNNLCTTMMSRCYYMHVRTNSECVFINYLSKPDVGRDTSIHFSPQKSQLAELFHANALGPGKDSDNLVAYASALLG